MKTDKFPLPPQFMECFYAGVAYKIACAIGDINLINITAQRYMSEKEKAKLQGFDISSNLNSTLQFKKGFY